MSLSKGMNSKNSNGLAFTSKLKLLLTAVLEKQLSLVASYFFAGLNQISQISNPTQKFKSFGKLNFVKRIERYNLVLASNT